MTPQIKSLIAKRQAAFNKKHTLLWRQLRNKVIKAICIAKETTYANWVRNLKKTSPGEWYKHIRVMSGQTSGTNNIFVPDVDPPNNKAVADAICCQFATVGGNIFPLDRASLPSYLPAQKPLRVQPYEVFSQLSHLKQRKSCGPDGISARFIKLFSHELSSPLCHIINTSLRDQELPTEWKQAHVVAVPKSSPAAYDNLCPIALTDHFAKTAEHFVAREIQHFMSNQLDKRQFGNFCGVSTTHCLVEVMQHFAQTCGYWEVCLNHSPDRFL